MNFLRTRSCVGVKYEVFKQHFGPIFQNTCLNIKTKLLDKILRNTVAENPFTFCKQRLNYSCLNRIILLLLCFFTGPGTRQLYKVTKNRLLNISIAIQLREYTKQGLASTI